MTRTCGQSGTPHGHGGVMASHRHPWLTATDRHHIEWVPLGGGTLARFRHWPLFVTLGDFVFVDNRSAISLWKRAGAVLVLVQRLQRKWTKVSGTEFTKTGQTDTSVSGRLWEYLLVCVSLSLRCDSPLPHLQAHRRERAHSISWRNPNRADLPKARHPSTGKVNRVVPCDLASSSGSSVHNQIVLSSIAPCDRRWFPFALSTG
jgi:hypothetical protein